jgi:alpha-glucosidase
MVDAHPAKRQAAPIGTCPGYKASNVTTTESSLTADLTLAGTACNTYGYDISNLTLQVDYQTGKDVSVVLLSAVRSLCKKPETITHTNDC